jgi:transposase
VALTGGKKVKGRKRHLVVDTQGNVVHIRVHAADISESDGAKIVLSDLVDKHPRVETILTDGGYHARDFADWVKTTLGWIVKMVKHDPKPIGFVVLQWRWIVERTLAWLNRNRRLSKDYEHRTEASESWVQIAAIHIMVKQMHPSI